ncbi:Maf family protein [Rhodoferax aquaticus]|uniref:dTTP/UTP pyrophosphatase n=1 Tax=Rhodoferax aquaticus TaxID=2527691 RepID=A0A515ENT0_9BURK|nr:Maf family protein [Rhodoferax aquaticus]QDL54290.1 septum formation inhibitor Maf [Rhodoferax aquaticus]
MPDFIYLASQSPRRSQLLTQLGVRHQLLLADAQEDAEALESVLGNESPKAYVQRVTMLKLGAALERRIKRDLPAAPVLCADTTVALGREILGKPVDADDAVRMLTALSGKTHRVMTAVALGLGAKKILTLSESLVTFAEMSHAEILAYVASGEPMGKAGAYAVQGAAAAYIARISGSYTGIVGLPLFETARLLKTVS